MQIERLSSLFCPVLYWFNFAYYGLHLPNYWGWAAVLGSTSRGSDRATDTGRRQGTSFRLEGWQNTPCACVVAESAWQVHTSVHFILNHVQTTVHQCWFSLLFKCFHSCCNADKKLLSSNEQHFSGIFSHLILSEHGCHSVTSEHHKKEYVCTSSLSISTERGPDISFQGAK